ncbi:PKD domain-containing protein [Candidatus Pacearchaeota archaeon]|nr:PKD domain-containing protein [Candidatus Pacearchaeota archaeon]
MKKRKILSFGVFLIVLFSLVCSVYASFNVGDGPGEIEKIYTPTAFVSGFINISLDNHNSESFLSIFDDEYKLIDVLKNQSYLDYNCIPNDCTNNYIGSGEESSKEFVINTDEKRIIGLKFLGILRDSPVTSLSFNLNSSSDISCNQPLKIDFFDDSDYDWIQTNGVDDFNCLRSVTCFNPTETLSDRIIDDKGYCQKIRVMPLPFFMVGADITLGTTQNPGLKMEVYNEDMEKLNECLIIENLSGEVKCKVSLSLLEETDIFVCIKANGVTDYKIKSEGESPCGFYDIEDHSDFISDYPIFAQGGKFAPVNGFVINSYSFRNYESPKNYELIESINDYLYSRYDNNCSNSCYVPINFISGINQNINLNNLNFVYSTDSGTVSSNNFYDIEKTSARINSDYIEIDLEKVNYSIPDNTGNKTLVIRLGGSEVLREDILIKNLPRVIQVSPLEVPAGILSTFTVRMNNLGKNSTYTWDFGDNSSIQTSDEVIIKHTYQEIGRYDLIIKAVSVNGESERIFKIKAISPIDQINETINKYKNDLNDFSNNLIGLSNFEKENIKNNLKIDEILNDILTIENKYEEGFIDDEKAVEIIKELNLLKIPYDVNTLLKINPSLYFLEENGDLDLMFLDESGAGNYKSEYSREDYIRAINSWILEEVDIKIESKTYSVSIRDKEDILIGSSVKFIISPKNEIRSLFFIINKNIDDIEFNGDYSVSPKSTSKALIELEDFSDSKTIEFFIFERIELSSLPVYVSPMFNELNLERNDPICNSNDVCDKNIGEDHNNCSDCEKPWLLNTLIFLIILFVVAFILYIILQEWYKRYYEKSLFKTRNHLFNLINFIYSAEIQNLNRGQIYNKLRGAGWNNEQLDFAWNKLHGKRTGMWEIPIFKSRENHEVRKELAVRKNLKFSRAN